MSNKQELGNHQERSAHSSPKDATSMSGDSIEVVESLPAWNAVLQSNPTLKWQAGVLGNPHLTTVQRQALASRLGRVNGNRYLQRVLAQMNASGLGTESSAVQRDDSDNTSSTATDSATSATTDSAANADQENADNQGSDGETPDVMPPEAEGGSGTGDYLEKAKALKVIQDSFGSYKTMVEGTVTILAQAEFQSAYDNKYGTTIYSWEKYIKPKFGNLGGFADKDKNINYINSNIASSTTVPHEMLHNNADLSWSPFVGSNIDEGTTEYLTFVALKAAKYTGMTSKYPNQYGVITDLVAVMGDEPLKQAYFKGANEDLRKAFNRKCKGAWVDFKTKMDEANWTQAKALAVANP